MKKELEIKENQCAICGKMFPIENLVKGSAVRDQVFDLIVQELQMELLNEINEKKE